MNKSARAFLLAGGSFVFSLAVISFLMPYMTRALEPLVGLLHPHSGWDGIIYLIIYALVSSALVVSAPVYVAMRKLIAQRISAALTALAIALTAAGVVFCYMLYFS